jgi:hypothetical protein
MKIYLFSCFLTAITCFISSVLCTRTLAQVPAIQWQKSYGGSGTDGSNCVQRTPDGGYITGGYSNSTNGLVTGNHGGMDCWVVKTDDTGKIVWEKSFGGSGDDQVNFLQCDVNGGYIISGSTSSNDGDVTGNHGGLDAWIIKIDDTGKILWQKVMGSSGFDFANFVVNTPDSGYFVVGSAGANDGDVSGLFGGNDVWAIRLNKTGGLVWDKVYGSTGYEYGFNGINTADGGFIITAQAGAANGDITTFRGGSADAWILKLDDTGAIQWQKTYGGSGFEQAFGISAMAGGYIFTAYTNSVDDEVTGLHGATNPDNWVVRIDDTGAIIWEKCFGSNGIEWPGSEFVKAFDGSFVFCGITTNNSGDVTGDHGNSDYWVFDVDTSGNLKWEECLGGTGFDTAVHLIQTPDSGFMVVGGSTSTTGQVSGNHGGEDFWMVKLNKQDTTINDKVQSIAINAAFSIFPNPATNEINISSGDKIRVITLSNLLGQTILNNEYPSVNTVFINISSLNQGIYFIKANGSAVRKLVKE